MEMQINYLSLGTGIRYSRQRVNI